MEIVIGGVVGAVLGLLGTVIVAYRQRSGGVHTSEAGELWEATSAFRNTLMARLEHTESRLANIERAEEECQKALREKTIQIADLERRLRRVENGH